MNCRGIRRCVNETSIFAHKDTAILLYMRVEASLIRVSYRFYFISRESS